MLKSIKIVECPRDAMQGIHPFIPTAQKAAYINALLQVGFDTLDFGSFVSPKAIPQMRDTALVLQQLNLTATDTKLLAIIANLRGAEEAIKFPEITYLGFPFSISETFQQRNTHTGINDALLLVEKLLMLCSKNNKEAVIYLSMGFGNPYGDPWNEDIVSTWGERLTGMGVKILSIADTIGMADKITISTVMRQLLNDLPQTEIGVHLHSTPEKAAEKINAAFESGCRRFDSALLGFGGCPMASDALTGNIATETLLSVLDQQGVVPGLNSGALLKAQELANGVFLDQ